MVKTKYCSNCGASSDFIKFKGGQCIDCINLKQREYRSKTGNSCTKQYEKTLKGYLVRTYRNMLSRVVGILKDKAHLYKDKEILDKEEFYKWSLSSTEFKRLLEDYCASDYDMKLAPSIDRINSEFGYTLDNIRWITHSENSKLGALQPREKYIMPVGGPQ